MNHAWRTYRALTVQTAVEAWRQPLPLLLTTTATLAAALFPLMTAFQFGEEGRLVRDGILALYFTFGVYLAAVTAYAVLGRDLRAAGGSLILSKAVSREMYFLSRFSGVLLVLALFTVCVGLAAMLSVRVGPLAYLTDARAGAVATLGLAGAFAAAGVLNYARRAPFVSTAHGLLPLGLLAALGVLAVVPAEFDAGPSLWSAAARMGPALILIFLALAVMAAAALLAAARVTSAPVVAAWSALVFLLGLASGPLANAAAEAGWGWVAGLAALLPDWQLFWPAEALSGGGSVPPAYLGWAALYAGAYTAGLLALGAAWFRGREIA